MTVLTEGPAETVATTASTPEPSACAGEIKPPPCARILVPVTTCKLLIASRTPMPTSLNGDSAVDGACPDATKRYSPSTTSKSTTRVTAAPTSWQEPIQFEQAMQA